MGINASYCKSDDGSSIGDEPTKPSETLVKDEEAGTHGSEGEVKATKAAKEAASDDAGDEESSESAEGEDGGEAEGEEEAEEKPNVEMTMQVTSTPYDPRFPTTNQARHCYTRYNEFYRCKGQKGEDDAECKFYQKAYRSICPGEWLEKWNEQRENGTWAGKY